MHNVFSNHERAEVLTQALPYIKRYNGKIVVVKYGGNAMINEALKQQVMEDIVLLWLIGVKIVLVHGGGPEISEMMAKLGIEHIDTPEVDYHMPYESTEALVEKDLVKVILPTGVSLDDVTSMVKVDVGEHIDSAKAKEDEASVTIVIEVAADDNSAE